MTVIGWRRRRKRYEGPCRYAGLRRFRVDAGGTLFARPPQGRLYLGHLAVLVPGYSAGRCHADCGDGGAEWISRRVARQDPGLPGPYERLSCRCESGAELPGTAGTHRQDSRRHAGGGAGRGSGHGVEPAQQYRRPGARHFRKRYPEAAEPQQRQAPHGDERAGQRGRETVAGRIRHIGRRGDRQADGVAASTGPRLAHHHHLARGTRHGDRHGAAHPRLSGGRHFRSRHVGL